MPCTRLNYFKNITCCKLAQLIGEYWDNAHLFPTLVFFLVSLKFDNDVNIKLGRAVCWREWVTVEGI